MSAPKVSHLEPHGAPRCKNMHARLSSRPAVTPSRRSTWTSPETRSRYTANGRAMHTQDLASYRVKACATEPCQRASRQHVRMSIVAMKA